MANIYALAIHALGSDQMALCASQYPGRVLNVVYLDATYDHETSDFVGLNCEQLLAGASVKSDNAS